MKIHYIQHVAFETPGMIAEWARARGHEVAGTRVFDGDTLPGIDAYDWLVVMGGPMNIHDHAAHPWFEAEKRAIKDAIERGKVVVGVCLGAQLVADVLGADVVRNHVKEIGWYPVTLTAEGQHHTLTRGVPQRFNAYHWHGDTFEWPEPPQLSDERGAAKRYERAVHLAGSEACAHQIFLYDNRVLGLQCHLEMTEPGIDDLIENCGHEAVPNQYVQSADAMRAGKSHLQGTYAVLDCLLDRLHTISQSHRGEP